MLHHRCPALSVWRRRRAHESLSDKEIFARHRQRHILRQSNDKYEKPGRQSAARGIYRTPGRAERTAALRALRGAAPYLQARPHEGGRSIYLRILRLSQRIHQRHVGRRGGIPQRVGRKPALENHTDRRHRRTQDNQHTQEQGTGIRQRDNPVLRLEAGTIRKQHLVSSRRGAVQPAAPHPHQLFTHTRKVYLCRRLQV